MDDGTDGKVRLDKWLWAARFYKTRSLAVEAISGGKVHVNDARAKPARVVRIGDELRITKGMYEWVIRVCALSAQRGPAASASTLYEEAETSRAARQLLAEQQRAQHPMGTQPARRPNKRDRRHIIRFKAGQA